MQLPSSAARALLLAAASALAISAAAQDGAAARTPAIAGVVAGATPIELIRDGYTGTEGPLALPDGSLIFTETQANRITRIDASGASAPYLADSNGANGLGLAANGDLYAVQVSDPRVGIIAPPGRVRILADNYQGARFGRPNDMVLDRQGRVYFTDSGAPAKPGLPATAAPAVYRIAPGGALQRIASDIERPNGIQLSPDEKVLYVANTLGQYVLAYDIGADGSIGARRNFARLAGWSKGEAGFSSGADGLAVDAQGRLYVASNVGIEVFSATGEPLGAIALPKKPQNLAFAGPDKKSLYVVGRGAAYKIAMLSAGYTERAK